MRSGGGRQGEEWLPEVRSGWADSGSSWKGSLRLGLDGMGWDGKGQVRSGFLGTGEERCRKEWLDAERFGGVRSPVISKSILGKEHSFVATCRSRTTLDARLRR